MLGEAPVKSIGVPPLRQRKCQVPLDSLHIVIRTCFTGWDLLSTVHCSGPLRAKVDLADQSVAEEDQDALVESLDLNALSAQSLTYLPREVVDVDVSV